MLDARTRQLMAQAQPSLPAAYDHHVDALHRATKGTSGRRPSWLGMAEAKLIAALDAVGKLATSTRCVLEAKRPATG